MEALVGEAVQRARARWGDRDGWWPGDGGLEVSVGAVLVQNAAWRNAEIAIGNLRDAGLLDLERLTQTSVDELERLIRPAGTYRRKARTVLALAGWFSERPGDSIEAKLAGPLQRVRAALLAVHGVGPETAAAILNYAGKRPVFVPDAFAKRILVRHGLIADGAKPVDVASWFEARTPSDATRLAELHAHVVSTGQEHCRPRVALCDGCPFSGWPFPRDLAPAERARRSSPGSSSPP